MENLNSEFEFISDAFNRLAKLAEDCFENPLIGMPVAKQQIKANKLNITMTKRWETFDELLEKYQLRELWDQFGNVRDRKGLVGVITHIQAICSLQIQAFTGMRHSEVQALPLNCLEKTVRIGSVRYLVRGVVTKLSRGKIKQACWVTSTRGKLAVELAQALARLIYRAKGRSMTGSLKAESQEFLFVTPIYLWKEGRGGKNISSHLALAPRFAQIKKLLQPTVLESDIAELSQIDPHRHWHLEDGTSIGKPWRFTSHQLRRSIALYAHRSGLVSLPSLKRQLQHITQEMSLYYARGASGAYDMANDFTLDNKFRDEWLSAKPLSQYLGYVTHVLSDDQTELFGGHFEWVKASNRHDRSNVYKSRDATFEQFRLGKLAFTITPVGGCTNPGPCDRNPIDVLHVDCIVENCRYLVGNIHKVERMIAIKNRELEAKRKVKVSLPELVHETAELAKLTTAMKKIQSKST